MVVVFLDQVMVARGLPIAMQVKLTSPLDKIFVSSGVLVIVGMTVTQGKINAIAFTKQFMCTIAAAN